MSCERERKVRQIVCMYLWFVGPYAITLSVISLHNVEWVQDSLLPVLIAHSPSSLTLTQELASSNSKSCSNSMRFA